MTTTGAGVTPIPGAGVDRRTLLSGGAAILLAGVAGCAQADEVTSAGQETLRLLSDRLIPTTDTPGAVEAGCVAYVAGCIDRAPPADRRRLIDSLGPIGSALRATAPDAPWSALLAKAQAASTDTARSLMELRGLVLAGYYTSEVGASKELRYDAIPGRFDPSVPVTPATRGFSSDWTGVAMGGRRG